MLYVHLKLSFWSSTQGQSSQIPHTLTSVSSGPKGRLDRSFTCWSSDLDLRGSSRSGYTGWSDVVVVDEVCPDVGR